MSIRLFQIGRVLLLFVLFTQAQVGNSTDSLKINIESFYELDYPERFRKIRDELRYGSYDSYKARVDSLLKYVGIEAKEIEKRNNHFLLLAEVKLDMAKFSFSNHRENVGPLIVDVAKLIQKYGDDSPKWNEIRALSYAQQAHNYSWDYEFELGKKFQNDAIAFMKLADNDMLLGRLYGELGVIYSDAGELDTAIVYYEKALKLGEMTRDTQWYIRADFLIAATSIRLKKLGVAKERLLKIIPVMKEVDHNNFGAAIGYLGDVEVELENFKSAKFWLDSANVITFKGSSLNSKINMSEKYVKYYSAIGDFKSALKAKDNQMKFMDQFNSELVKAKRIEQESIFSKQLQDQKIEALELKNQIAAAKLRSWVFGLSAFFVLLLGSIGFYFYRQRQIQERNILIANKEIETQDIRQKLLTSITHELRTPLSVVIGKLQSLQQSKLKTSDLVNINLAHESAQQLIEQVNQLLEWNKVEAKAIKVHPAIGNVKKEIEKEITTQKINAEHKNIKWDILIDVENPNGYLDFEKFRTILSNLISNAIKYAPNNTHIGVEAKMHNDFLNLKVLDQGPGIPASQLSKVFDWYYRVANSKDQDKFEGFGIGLALSKELADLMKGNLSVQSIEGQGATFLLSLPFKSESILEDGKNKVGVSKDNLLGLSVDKPMVPTLLIVEDHEGLGEHIQSLFNDKFEVHLATDFKSGERIAKKIIPDCIISDIMLPDGSGLELCKILKSHLMTNHIPILMLTARTDDQTRFEGLKLRADGFLTKPFNNQELVLSVNNLIQNRRILKLRYDQNAKLSEPVTDPFLELVENVLEKKHADPDFNIDIFASELSLSRGQFYRKVRATLDNTPTTILRNYRLVKAHHLLQNSKNTIAEIAYQCGFSTPEYFSTVYRSYFDHSPSETRAKSI